MHSHWGNAARADIAKVVAGLPDDASLDDIRKALRAHSGAFHCGTSWGKKVWPRECRKYLELRGQQKRRPEDARQPRLLAALERGDITFPFRP